MIILNETYTKGQIHSLIGTWLDNDVINSTIDETDIHSVSILFDSTTSGAIFINSEPKHVYQFMPMSELASTDIEQIDYHSCLYLNDQDTIGLMIYQ